MDFLTRAEDYAESNGDGIWFRDWYSTFRKEYSVRVSVWNTLAYLYDCDLADRLEERSALLSTSSTV